MWAVDGGVARFLAPVISHDRGVSRRDQPTDLERARVCPAPRAHDRSSSRTSAREELLGTPHPSDSGSGVPLGHPSVPLCDSRTRERQRGQRGARCPTALAVVARRGPAGHARAPAGWRLGRRVYEQAMRRVITGWTTVAAAAGSPSRRRRRPRRRGRRFSLSRWRRAGLSASRRAAFGMWTLGWPRWVTSTGTGSPTWRSGRRRPIRVAGGTRASCGCC